MSGPTIPDASDAVISDVADQASAAVLTMLARGVFTDLASRNERKVYAER
jgi:hypothetical protein